MEKVTTKRYRRRNGIVVSEEIRETIKYDKRDRNKRDQSFNLWIFMGVMFATLVIAVLAIFIVEALY